MGNANSYKGDIQVQWKVCVRCYTFNHAPYIVDAMHGFSAQQTEFPFVCCIVDDASTDGEQEVIKKYIDENFTMNIKEAYTRSEEYGTVIFARHKINYNCYFAVILLSRNHNSTSELKAKKRSYISEWENNCEYEALCEGDDYWIDPLKLQKQVDFLDRHPNYSVCLTKFICYKEKTNNIFALSGEQYSSLRDMLWRDLQFGTATIVLRQELYLKYQEEIQPFKKNWLMGDKPLILYMATQGLVKTLRDITAVYRILEISASHSLNINLQLKRARNTIDIYHFFANKYLPNDIQLSQKIEGGYLYRAYLVYYRSQQSIPAKLKEDINNYKGKYYKVIIVKLMLKIPLLQRIMYDVLRKKNEIVGKLRVGKKINNDI
ncbi:MAG: glycosyltransferase family 2 protein [Muribaculaceae bacterium]|nr:glycosyltransferase family 2 protein [Muribaculaceae bacterium]